VAQPELDCSNFNPGMHFRSGDFNSGGLVQNTGFLGNSAQLERCWCEAKFVAAS
jgi:hypothetical protein